MSLEWCQTCKSANGYLCGTCGQPRDFSEPRRRSGPHGRCAKRRSANAAKPCPSHTDVTARCDYCRTTAIALPPSGFTHRDNYHRIPDGWVAQTSKMDACPTCATRLAIAGDAIVGTDLGDLSKQRDVALDRLVRTLNWVKGLTPAQVTDIPPSLRVCVFDLLGLARDTLGNATRETRVVQGLMVSMGNDGRVVPANSTSHVIGVVVATHPDGTADVMLGGSDTGRNPVHRYQTRNPVEAEPVVLRDGGSGRFA